MENITGIILYINGAMLLAGGIMVALFSKNIIKMIIGFTVAETGVNVILITTGFINNKVAPILSKFQQMNAPASVAVDPVPQALVLTAIVIGIAVSALFLFYSLRFYTDHKTLDRDHMEESDD